MTLRKKANERLLRDKCENAKEIADYLNGVVSGADAKALEAEVETLQSSFLLNIFLKFARH